MSNASRRNTKHFAQTRSRSSMVIFWLALTVSTNTCCVWHLIVQECNCSHKLRLAIVAGAWAQGIAVARCIWPTKAWCRCTTCEPQSSSDVTTLCFGLADAFGLGASITPLRYGSADCHDEQRCIC